MLDAIPDLRSLAVLVAVADEGSFGAAARRLDTSQQAVSERVRRAEAACRLTLFHRTPTGAYPTPAGADIIRQARRVLESARELAEVTEAQRDPDHAIAHVAASQTVLDHYIPRWLAAAGSGHPGLRFRVDGGNSRAVAEAVARGETTLGFIESLSVPASAAGELTVAVVTVDELVLAVPAGHPWAGGEVDRETVRATPLIVRETGSGSREVAETRLGPLVPPRAELAEQAALPAAVRALGSPGIVPAVALSGAADLRAVRVDGVAMTRPIRAVWRRGGRPRGAVALLLDAARTVR